MDQVPRQSRTDHSRRCISLLSQDSPREKDFGLHCLFPHIAYHFCWLTASTPLHCSSCCSHTHQACRCHSPLRQMLPWPEALFLGVRMAHSLPSTMPLLNWHLINLSMRLYSSSLIKYEYQPLIQYPVYLDLFFLFYLHHLTYYILLASLLFSVFS